MTNKEDLNRILKLQKEAHLRDGPLTIEKRKEWIDKLIDSIIKYQDQIPQAISDDFSHRSITSSLLTDVASSITSLKIAKSNLKNWMKPSKRKVSPAILGLLGAKLRVEYQPLGTVGLISPWNFPVVLTFGPLGSIFAAGNRVMIKPSEYTPKTSDLMKKMFEENFSEEEVAVVTGGPEVGADFSSLPFDHLLFTGATSVGKHVMRAASENLVPVTLELGGKSPVILSESCNIEVSAKRIMAGKTMNAGQICLSPDYVLLPENKLEGFVSSSKAAVTKMFPTLKDNDDYTSLITLLINPNDDLKVMQEEIFGPVLPIKTYKDFDETITYVNKKDRPLGLYYFGKDNDELNTVLDKTTSGGVTVNDVIFHVSQDNAPFGGVGPSGIGSYHGEEGFKNFSHAKTIFTQTNMDNLIDVFRPPYGKKAEKALKDQIKP